MHKHLLMLTSFLWQLCWSVAKLDILMFWRANLAWKTSKPDLLLTIWMQCFLPHQLKDLETLSHGSIPGPSMVSMNCNRVATCVASIHSIAHISLWKQESMLVFFNWCLWLLNEWWFEQVFLVLLFNPLNLCYRSSRFFFLRVWQHVICAPFYKVLILPISLDPMHQMTHLSTPKAVFDTWRMNAVAGGASWFFPCWSANKPGL